MQGIILLRVLHDGKCLKFHNSDQYTPKVTDIKIPNPEITSLTNSDFIQIDRSAVDEELASLGFTGVIEWKIFINSHEMEKTLNVKDSADLKAKVSDIEIVGNGDLFQLIAKASSKEQGWMKSTKAMGTGNGIVIQVTTQQKNPDGSYAIAEALTFVPDVTINIDRNGNKSIGYLDI